MNDPPITGVVPAPITSAAEARFQHIVPTSLDAMTEMLYNQIHAKISEHYLNVEKAYERKSELPP